MFEVRRIEFEIGFLYNVTNSEYLNLYKTIHQRLDDANYDNSLIQMVLPYMSPHIEVMRTYMHKSSSHGFTSKIQELKRERRKLLRSLRDLIDGSLNRETKEMRQAAQQLTFMINDLRENIRSRNSDQELSAVIKVDIRLRHKEEYQEALKVLHLESLVKSLIETNQVLTELERVRMDDSSEKKYTKERRKNSYEVLKNVLDSINLAIMMEEHKGNEELAQEIYMMGRSIVTAIINVRREYRKRQTINKKKNRRRRRKMTQENSPIEGEVVQDVTTVVDATDEQQHDEPHEKTIETDETNAVTEGNEAGDKAEAEAETETDAVAGTGTESETEKRTEDDGNDKNDTEPSDGEESQ